MTMIRTRSDVVYGICRGLPSDVIPRRMLSSDWLNTHATEQGFVRSFSSDLRERIKGSNFNKIVALSKKKKNRKRCILRTCEPLIYLFHTYVFQPLHTLQKNAARNELKYHMLVIKKTIIMK